MEYNEVIGNLKRSINCKGLNQMFADSVKILKDDFKEDVSTKFLRSLSDLDDTRKKTKRVSYLLRQCGFKTKRALNMFKVRGVISHNAEVITWGAVKKEKPFKEIGLTEQEKSQIRQLKEIQNETGISLFNHAEEESQNRQKKTDAFNIGGGAVIRDVKVVRVGSYAVLNRGEVLFMIQ